MGLALQPAARRDLVDVAVNVDLQQRARMIGWTSGRFWNHTVKAQRPEIQLIDKHVDHPHRVVLSNVVIQILGKQNALSTDFTLDEAHHLTPRRESSRIITQQAFSHSLGGDPDRTPKVGSPRVKKWRLLLGLPLSTTTAAKAKEAAITPAGLIACARNLLIFANTVLTEETSWATKMPPKLPKTNGC